jgi:glycosyltransferase involved in cell wall biosynthesis/predicted  nucleic acid-binding Zn-ribbon protein
MTSWAPLGSNSSASESDAVISERVDNPMQVTSELERITREARIEALQRANSERDRRIAALEGASRASDERTNSLERELVSNATRVETLNERVKQREVELADLRTSLGEREVELADLRTSLGALHASTSWRITAPLRRIASGLTASQRNTLRWIARLGYWILTPHRTASRLRLMRARDQEIGQLALGNTGASAPPNETTQIERPEASPVAGAPSGASNSVSVEHSGRAAIVEEIIGYRRERIAQLEGELASQGAWAKELERVNGERDGQIVMLEGALGRRDERIAELERELESALGRRDERIAELERELESALGRRDERIAELERELESALERRDERIAALERELISRHAPIAPFGKVGSERDHSPVGTTRWFFVGDVLQWLEEHERVSGVGRVTCELFFASLKAQGQRYVPCVRGATPSGLISVPYWDTAVYLGGHFCADILKSANRAPPTPFRADHPRKGDHVLFTGVVWNSDYIELFRQLTDKGVSLDVLVHDIIPISRPDLVTEQYRAMFSEWLKATIAIASVIYVCSPVVRDEVVRWSILGGHQLNADVVVAEFGNSEVERAMSGDELSADPAIAGVRLDAFVLSVGTIDKRKNQLSLCRIWARLISAPGEANVPQLVLVGRDDLGLRSVDAKLSELIRNGKIVVLKGPSDAQLFGLYHACLFTVFPSLSEGYGLPVAESLFSGKLCISADLPAIRSHAGDLPWYFDPTDDDAAFALLRTAIEQPELRAETERRIKDEYRAKAWTATFETIAASAGRSDGARPGNAPATNAAAQSGDLDAATSLRKVQTWCTSREPDVSIVIINSRSSALTLECVKQIWTNTDGTRYEIVIVDGGSDPQHLVMLRMIGAGAGGRLLELGCDRHFGEANNIAVERAAGRYVCVLNNGVSVEPDWLKSLVHGLDETPEAGAAGPLVLSPDGSIQEAGALVDKNGIPTRLPSGKDGKAHLARKFVDYISGAALLVRRETFTAVGGFDLAYEPGGYEDIDLCFKFAAIGKKVLFCPAVVVVQRWPEPVDDDPTAEQRRSVLRDINREKFVERWGDYLRTRSWDAARTVAANLALDRPIATAAVVRADRKPSAAVFTPYDITPGGGERYILTLACALIRDFAVTIVTPFRYSHLRLRQIGTEFGIDLSVCDLMTTEEFRSAPRFDFFVAMGNHIVPPIELGGMCGVFMCQFPFRLPSQEITKGKGLLGDYAAIIVNSEYTKANVCNALSVHQISAPPVKIVYPPVPQLGGDARKKKMMIVAVGRFFVGGHDKRHDLMIEAFRSLIDNVAGDIELHLAGSSVPNQIQLNYLNRLKAMAEGLPVFLHVNLRSSKLHQLYRDAAIYWHATGLHADLEKYPEKAEHFGISLVEAMSAECVTLAFNAGGPREVIQHSVDGLLYDSIEELVRMTRMLLDPQNEGKRIAIGQAARHRAAEFSVDRFIENVRTMATTMSTSARDAAKLM